MNNLRTIFKKYEKLTHDNEATKNEAGQVEDRDKSLGETANNEVIQSKIAEECSDNYHEKTEKAIKLEAFYSTKIEGFIGKEYEDNDSAIRIQSFDTISDTGDMIQCVAAGDEGICRVLTIDKTDPEKPKFSFSHSFPGFEDERGHRSPIVAISKASEDKGVVKCVACGDNGDVRILTIDNSNPDKPIGSFGPLMRGWSNDGVLVSATALCVIDSDSQRPDTIQYVIGDDRGRCRVFTIDNSDPEHPVRHLNGIVSGFNINGYRQDINAIAKIPNTEDDKKNKKTHFIVGGRCSLCRILTIDNSDPDNPTGTFGATINGFRDWDSNDIFSITKKYGSDNQYLVAGYQGLTRILTIDNSDPDNITGSFGPRIEGFQNLPMMSSAVGVSDNQYVVEVGRNSTCRLLSIEQTAEETSTTYHTS